MDDDEFEPLPPDLAKPFAELERQRGKLWDQMLQHLAEAYSLGDLAILDDRARLGLDDELGGLIENWMEADHDAPNPLRVETDLQHLLAQYHRLGEMLLDIHDEAIERRTRGGEP